VADDLTGSSETPASRTARLVGFAVLGAFGAYALYVAVNLGLWRGRSPGEGLFPFLTATGMLAFSAAGIVVALKAPRDDGAPGATQRPQLLRMGFYLAVLLFYALTLERLGFIAATIISIGAILRFAERYSWLASLAIAVAAAAGCHVLFGRWLGAILPAGTLWERFTG
jgi:tripartite tricarboxylate transporter TctB family protein